MGYVLGLDAGGTKSHLAIFDENVRLIGMHRWSGLNHEGMPGSFEQFEREFGQFVRGALDAHGLAFSDISRAVFGVAGCDTEEQYGILSDIARRVGFPSFGMYNDAFLGIPAGSGEGTGICAINGTGCTLAGVDAKGRRLQVGGVGSISNDMGGGGHLGARVVGSVYTELYRCGEKTAMTGEVMSILGIADKSEYVDAMSSFLAEGNGRFDRFNLLLYPAAEAGDAVALRILSETAENYAGGVECMLREMDFPSEKDVCIVMAGSVFVKQERPVLRDLFAAAIRRRCPGRGVRMVTLNAPPVAGAVIWALSDIGRTGVRESVCAQIEGAAEREGL